jgi:hypothetical protein
MPGTELSGSTNLSIAYKASVIDSPHDSDISMLFLPEALVATTPETRTRRNLAEADTMRYVWGRFIKGKAFATEGADPCRVQVG